MSPGCAVCPQLNLIQGIQVDTEPMSYIVALQQPSATKATKVCTGYKNGGNSSLYWLVCYGKLQQDYGKLEE